MDTNKLLSLINIPESSYRLKNDRIFLVDPPGDMSVSSENDEKIFQKERWTNWRRHGWIYLRKHLTPIDSEAVVVDVGAGRVRYRDLISRFGNYIGVDFIPYDLIKVVTDITQPLPFKDGVADVVILSNTLEHVPTPGPLLRECYRILKKKGVLIGIVPFLVKIHLEPYDFFRYTHYMLKRLMAKSGFSADSLEIISLDTPLDLYKTVQRNFFSYLYGGVASRRDKMLAALAARLNSGLNKFFSPLYKKIKSSPKFTGGYGFRAVK